MKRIMQLAALILILPVILGAVSQSVSGQEREPAPIHSPFVKTGYDKTADSVQTIQMNGQAATTSSPMLQVNGLQATTTSNPTGLVTLGAWRNMRPTESYLRDVSMLPENVAKNVNCTDADQQSKGWAVGDGGVILTYCHGIWDHAIITESIVTSLYGVAAVTPTLAFAVGENGTILQYGWDTTSGKYTWKKWGQVSQHTLNRISVVPNGSTGSFIAWAVGDQDGNLKRSTLVRGDITPSVDAYNHPIYVSNWNNVTNSYGNLPQTDMYFGVQMLSTTSAWTVASDYVNWKGYAMHWNGSNWSPFLVGSDPLYGVFFKSDSDGWAVGEGGGIYHFNGSTWSKDNSPVSTPLADVSFDSNGVGWAIGFNGVIVKYSGGKWTQFTDLRTDPIDFYALDHTSGHGWMVGYNDSKRGNTSYGVGGQILEYDDNAWLSVTVPTDNTLNDLVALSDTDAWAVGAADDFGSTIIHWDGRHWQRWFQNDPPLPKGDLYSIDMLSPTNGWAAGEPPSPGSPAVLLHWDGHRWAPPRDGSPINVRVNAIRLIRTNIGNGIVKDFGWAVADAGNALAKLDINANNKWDAVHTYGGLFYQLRGLSVIPSTEFLSDGHDWDAWAVGENQSEAPYYDTFMRFMKDPAPSTGNSWQEVDYTANCPDESDPHRYTNLYSIRMLPPNGTFPNLSGYASGSFDQRASIYQYNGAYWETIWCQPKNVSNPSQLNSVDAFEDSHITWFGGYYSINNGTKKVAFIAFIDQNGYRWGSVPYPLNGVNIYDRPISRLRMSNETMGWAVGDREDPRKISALYQYPYPNFTLKLSPASGAMRPGTSYDFAASLGTLGYIGNSVNLSYLSLPSGFHVQISPTTVTDTTNSNIHISLDSSVAPGTYTVPIQGYSIVRSGDIDLPLYRTTNLTVVVTNHPVQIVSPDLGPQGTVVTITGQNFGTVPAGQRSTAANNVFLAGAQMPDANVTQWTDTTIKVNVPDDKVLFPDGPTNDFVQVTVTMSGVKESSNNNLDFQLENRLSNYTVSKESSYYVITLTGTSLGNDPGYLNRNTDLYHIYFGDSSIDYWDVRTWDNNQIVFQIPLTTDLTDKKVQLTSNGYESNELVVSQTVTNPHVFLPFVVH